MTYYDFQDDFVKVTYTGTRPVSFELPIDVTSVINKGSYYTYIQDRGTYDVNAIVWDISGGTLASRGSGLHFTPKQNQTLSFKIAFKEKTSDRVLNLDANGGAFTQDKTDVQVIDTTNRSLTAANPTRDGYSLKGWNTKADGTGDDVTTLGSSIQDMTTIYAQWEKDPGNPTRAKIDCTANGNAATCSVIAYYADGMMRTREPTATSTGKLSWTSVGGIAGVNLDDTGYAGDSSCVTYGSGGSATMRCYYVSLANQPPTTGNGYAAQAPQTGDPAASVWQVLPYVVAVSAIMMAVVVMRRKPRSFSPRSL